MALRLSIDFADGDAIAGVAPLSPYEQLPDRGERDHDFDRMREVLFEDHDGLMPYNPALDGIEIDFDSNDSSTPGTGSGPLRG